MNGRNIAEISRQAVAERPDYLEGFFTGAKSRNYFLGINYASAVVNKKFSHPGSALLDCINAFDLAEVAQANIGQINMIKVSSFCGPDGIIWGYDVAQVPKEINHWGIDPVGDTDGNKIPIYDADPLREAFKKLTGTVSKKRFPFLPAAHVPCAAKFVTVLEPGFIFSAVGIGIPVERDKAACLIMEDIGSLSLEELGTYGSNYQEVVVNNLAKSIVQIGKNQQVKFKEIFAGISEAKVEKEQAGCSLVAMPYFVLAKNAYPKDQDLDKLSLSEWEKSIFKI